MTETVEIRRPDVQVDRVVDISFGALAAMGFRKFLCDVDNTLACKGEMEAKPEIIAAIEQARRSGYIEGLYLVSNTIFDPFRKRKKRVASIARSLGADGCYCAGFFQKKPCLLPYHYGLKALGADAREVAFIGDQLFTDVLGAQRLGIYTVLVKPLGEDNIFTRPNRRREIQQLSEWGIE